MQHKNIMNTIKLYYSKLLPPLKSRNISFNDYSLLGLIFIAIKNYVSKSNSINNDISFPKKINQYSFLNNFNKPGVFQSYRLGIYRDIKGNEAIAKIRSSQTKDYQYLSLKNEIQLYELLNRIEIRVKQKNTKQNLNVFIPKLLTKKETKDIILALFQFIKADITKYESPNKKVAYYIYVIKYLDELSKEITPEEKKLLTTRKAYEYIYFYPILLIKAIMVHPEYTKMLLKGSIHFIKNIPIFIQGFEQGLVHRDLHFKNILNSGKSLVLVDLQHFVSTDPVQEFTTTLRYYWGEKTFSKLLLKELIKTHGNRKNFLKIFQSFIISSVTHGLIDKRHDKKLVADWVKFLEFGLKMKRGDLYE